VAKEDQVTAEVQDGQGTWLVTVRLGAEAKTKLTCEKK
jgi:hypothetical protein